MNDANVRYRPTSFEECLSTSNAFLKIPELLKVDKLPHVMFFMGPPGIGKTTLARIVASEIANKYYSKDTHEVYEIHCGVSGGVAYAREIADDISADPKVPLIGTFAKIYILDEAQKLTEPAMDALLKPLEDSQDHRYIIFCSTSDIKTNKALADRCVRFNFAMPPPDYIKKFAITFCKQNNIKLPDNETLSNLCTSVTSIRSLVRALDLEEYAPEPTTTNKEFRELLIKHAGAEIDRYAFITQGMSMAKNLSYDKFNESVIKYAIASYYKNGKDSYIELVKTFSESRSPIPYVDTFLKLVRTAEITEGR